MLKQVVEFIVKGLVENPEGVTVSMQESDAGYLITIAANDSQKGRIIGRDGKTINAIRTLVCAIAQTPKKVSVEIVSQ